MNECNSLEIDKAKLTEQTKIRLDIISEIEIIFIKKLIKGKYAVKN